MTPEQLRQFEEMGRELKELREWKANKTRQQISQPLDLASQGVIISSGALQRLTLSSKAADSEDATPIASVNFGAQSTTTMTVLDNPDAFLEVVINNTTYYIPAFT